MPQRTRGGGLQRHGLEQSTVASAVEDGGLRVNFRRGSGLALRIVGQLQGIVIEAGFCARRLRRAENGLAAVFETCQDQSIRSCPKERCGQGQGETLAGEDDVPRRFGVTDLLAELRVREKSSLP